MHRFDSQDPLYSAQDTSDSGLVKDTESLSSEMSSDRLIKMTALTQPAHSTWTQLDDSIFRVQQFLTHQQHADGHWCAELEGDSILQSEYLLLLAFLGELDSDIARKTGNHLRSQQNRDGSWSMYPGGSIEVSASVKAYLALKLLGDDIQSSHMIRAREAILMHGGAEKVNSFTRYYLALLGLIDYSKCPAVPPELILLPHWFPLSLSAMSAWSRTIVVPLSFLWAYKPRTKLPNDLHIRELFLSSPEALPVIMPESEMLDKMSKKSWVPWRKVFNVIDLMIKGCENIGFKPLRKLALKKSLKWMLDRFADSDGLGAIFPPIVWSIIALKVSGYASDAPEMLEARKQLDDLILQGDDSIRLQPCKSPVWDTAIATLAMRESGVPHHHPMMEKAREWLLSKEVREYGDWADRRQLQNKIAASGWFFEYRNKFYPDIDDTIMVLMALKSLLGEEGETWQVDHSSPGNDQMDLTNAFKSTTSLSGRVTSLWEATKRLQTIEPVVQSLTRGIEWVKAMQSRDGGWGAFDADNTCEILTRVPFADHNAMIDPSTADITARTLEMYGRLGLSGNTQEVYSALALIFDKQETDGSWFGRWGVNYIYGTWQVLVGLQQIGHPMLDPRVQQGADWLESIQQHDGGWGESAYSYEVPEAKGIGKTTASQTAWALMGLLAAGRHRSPAVIRGVQYLIHTQNQDGTWNEDEFTGTGFPKVFYLRYHYYRIYFPLMALARYRRLATANDQTR
jgi:squalene-hopene/tetraprenyl-beta-curcumene cyclase